MNICLNVAFSGHRNMDEAFFSPRSKACQEKLLARLPLSLRRAFDIVLEAQYQLSKKTDGLIDQNERAPRLRLVSGLAKGSDTLAINTWRSRKYGEIHALLPFVDEGSEFGGITDDDDPDQITALRKDEDRLTILDGAGAKSETPPFKAHLELARWLVRFADVLVVVWDGKEVNGPGGTADVVQLALRKGTPVLWINPFQPSDVRLIKPSAFSNFIKQAEIAEALSSSKIKKLAPLATADELIKLLEPQTLPTWLQSDQSELSASEVESDRQSYESFMTIVRKGNSQQGFWFRLLFGSYDFLVWRYSVDVTKLTPKSIWKRVRKRLLGINEPEEETSENKQITAGNTCQNQADQMPLSKESLMLKGHQESADQAANRLSMRHRSDQIRQLQLATLAVGFGVMPALEKLWMKELGVYFKTVCVGIEVLIIGLMVFLWLSASRSARHRSWSDARYFGERLRGMKVCWPMGVDPTDIESGRAATWGEWLARSLRRSMGPPIGTFSSQQVMPLAEAANKDLVKGQETYHQDTGVRTGTVHHRMEAVENGLLVMLMMLLLGFLFVVLHPWVLDRKIDLLTIWKDDYGTILLFLSAVIPAIGASYIAIEAKLDFAGTHRRSAAMEPRFAGQADELEKQIEAEAVVGASQTVREAAALALTDVDSWRHDLERRRIVRGP